MSYQASTALQIGCMTLAMALQASEALPQTSLDCLPPIPPLPVADPITQAEYRHELTQEYLHYFDDTQTYLRCLEAARWNVTEQVNRAIIDYQALSKSAED
ncbi:MAG: hypothetical protein DI533_17090 [Cereibacter sphaeroides]|uniref:Uncharacterized protein n=1 Tax=Cereibacter sphaeroides TaxID=1063 RepID=A0A2W5S533_CERSP|nr:MAG: hypothetical protein DI533_17090 [Cereibacter sphaeroides]